MNQNTKKLFPKIFRILVVGESGRGKNVLLSKMLLEDIFLDFNNLIFYSTTIDQPELKVIANGFKFEDGCSFTKAGIRDIFDKQNILLEMIKKIGKYKR